MDKPKHLISVLKRHDVRPESRGRAEEACDRSTRVLASVKKKKNVSSVSHSQLHGNVFHTFFH